MSVKAFWCWFLVVQQHVLLVTFTAHTFEQPPQLPPCISIRNADSAHSPSFTACMEPCIWPHAHVMVLYHMHSFLHVCQWYSCAFYCGASSNSSMWYCWYFLWRKNAIVLDEVTNSRWNQHVYPYMLISQSQIEKLAVFVITAKVCLFSDNKVLHSYVVIISHAHSCLVWILQDNRVCCRR